MTHYKKYFPTGFIDEADLPKDVTVTVSDVTRELLPLPGRDVKKPCPCGSETEQGEKILYGDCCAMKVVVSFAGAKKKMVLNKTNATRIARMHGNDTKSWNGKEVTLYFDEKVKFGRETVGGVRIRSKS